MNIVKKTLCTVLALAFVCLSFAGCGGNSDTKASDLEKVKSAGKITVGMECAYAPYNWSQTSENEYTVKVQDGLYADGYDIQIAKKVADSLGVSLEIKPIEWNGLLSALNSGQIDLIIAGMSPTEERKLSIDFTDTYYDSNLVMVVKKDSAYASATKISDFSGAKITGQLNTFHYKVIDQIEGVNKQTALEDFAALIQALSSGTVDGYVCEKPGAVSAVASHPEFTYVEFSKENGFTCDPAESSISIGVRKNSDLTEKINTILSGISKDEREKLMDGAIERQPAGE